MRYDRVMFSLWKTCVEINDQTPIGSKIINQGKNYTTTSPATVLGYTVSIGVGDRGQTVVLADMSSLVSQPEPVEGA